MLYLRNSISRSTISMLFFQIVLIEIFLGGSGQLFSIYGGLSLRMLLFGCMPLVCVITKGIHFNRRVVFICFIFTLLLAIGAALSYVGNNDIFLFEDIKPLLYFYTIMYFYETVSTKDYADVFIKLLIRCTVLVSVVYLIYLSLVKLDILPFPFVYEVLSTETDIMFRGNEGEFYFKGFIFLPIALSFIVFRKGLFNLSSILILLAIYYSQTRALYLLAFVIIILYIIYNKRYNLLIIMVVMFVAFLYTTPLDIVSTFDNRAEGDLIRVTTLKQVVERINIFSFIFGHGLGYGVPAKVLHMEMAYLEIFHKQGVVGLLFWALYLVHSVLAYLGSALEKRKYLLPFLLSIFIVYIQSLFNPYLINSMGMCILFISTTVLLRFNKVA